MNTSSLTIKIKRYFTILLAVVTVGFTTSCETVACTTCGGDGRTHEEITNEYTDANGDVWQETSYYTCKTCGGSGSITQPNALGKTLLVLSFVGIIIAAAADN